MDMCDDSPDVSTDTSLDVSSGEDEPVSGMSGGKLIDGSEQLSMRGLAESLKVNKELYFAFL